ncbi:MAG TPA: hypothetical protein PK858_07490, partial [Saprospiraceae bacterium]|nr:hypothetical protein [Saprospiraceae bacterium]
TTKKNNPKTNPPHKQGRKSTTPKHLPKPSAQLFFHKNTNHSTPPHKSGRKGRNTQTNSKHKPKKNQKNQKRGEIVSAAPS